MLRSCLPSTTPASLTLSPPQSGSWSEGVTPSFARLALVAGERVGGEVAAERLELLLQALELGQVLDRGERRLGQLGLLEQAAEQARLVARRLLDMGGAIAQRLVDAGRAAGAGCACSRSSAPALISASSRRRLRMRPPARAARSKRSANGPPAARSATSASTAWTPTPRIAASA